jgi:ABC-type dipeptide/oligopeptide/nickel transport system permease subunit
MSAALGPSIQNVVFAISIPIIPRAARVIRASVLSIREMQYVEAARAMGLRHLRIAFRHILPNTIGPFIVLGTAQLGSAILVEAALSFLGLGVPEPYPSWGRMLSVSAAEYAQKAPWLVLFPGIAISLTVFGSNLLGDASATHTAPAALAARRERAHRFVGASTLPSRTSTPRVQSSGSCCGWLLSRARLPPLSESSTYPVTRGKWTLT